jgi:glycosyltransferase involved in cell wall biosynthesis
MDTPLVSIIINNYNYGEFLNAAIDSALKQTYLQTEVIVVDDGSTDNSHEIIKSYGKQIIPVLKPNGGQASAFNAGFEVSQGDIICFLDSDDIFLSEKVAAVVDVFNAYQDIGWCYHPLQLIDNTTGEYIASSYQWLSGKYDLRAAIEKGNLNKFRRCFPATSGLCFKRSLLQMMLPMPEEITIISDNFIKFTAVLLSQGFTLSQALALQRIHNNNAYTLRKNKQLLEAKIHILTAYWMRQNFPRINKFANNTFAIGLGIYWRFGGVETKYQEVVKSYLSSLLPLEGLEISLRAFYHRVKFRGAGN